MKESICIFLLFVSFHVVSRERPDFHVKDLAKVSKENRLNYFFSMEYTWQKEPFRFQQIDSLRQMAKNLKDDKLAQYTELLWFEYKIYLAKDSTEKASYFKKAEQFAEDSDFPELKAHLYYAIGIYAFYLKDLKYGLPLVYRSKKILDHIGYHKFRHRAYYYKGFFDLYFFFEDFNTAIQFEELTLKTPVDLLYDPADYYNNIGVAYKCQKNYSKALEYYSKAVEDAKKKRNISLINIIESNIGVVHYLKKEFKQALPYFYKNLAVNNKLPEEAYSSKYLIANCLLQLDSVKKAETFLRNPDAKLPIWINPTYILEKYRVLSLYYEKTGKLGLAILYRDSLVMAKDSIKYEYDIKKIKLFENQLQAEQSLADQTKLEIEIEHQKYLLNSILFFIAILFTLIFGALYYRYKKENQIQLVKQKLTDERSSNANTQLDLFLSKIKEKNELIEKLSLELELYNDQNSELNKKTNLYIDELRSNTILTEDSWREFKTIFEKTYPQFFNKLTYDFANISPAETRLAVLEKLKLPTREMANMLGVSADSIKKARYRFKKKYPNLLPEESQDVRIENK